MPSGTLYLVGTPIGNLKDFSPRGREVLAAVDGPITLGDFGEPHQDGSCDHEGQCVLYAVWKLAGEHMRQLLDGELAANNGGWQWSAGCGTDAAPYFRIFNPVSQGEKFDPQGTFVRRWIPELRDVPDDLIHQPWEKPLLLARTKYPAPIVDHSQQRGKCLAMFKAVKGAE